MKKFVIALSSILLLTAVAAGGYYWYRFSDNPLDFKENLTRLKEELNPKESDPVYVTLVSTITGSSSGVVNRYAGVVEPQSTLEVKLESNRVVKKLAVKEGEEVKKGQLLFEYDLSNIENQLQEENLAYERLKNEALSLQEQIATLEKEKQKASADNQLSYTIEIETDKMNLKKNEYDQKAQEAKIQRLQNATGNTEVRSEIDGVIQKIDTSQMTADDSASVTDSLVNSDSSYDMGSDNNGAFIKILSTGAYRVKGKVNELNISEIVYGAPVLIRSRADETVTWSGTFGTVDRENADKNEDDYSFGMSSSDSLTNSSSYPFYVELESSDGLMLGQHVYIEPDNGQEEKKSGLWLSELYLVDIEKDTPYVWASNDKKRLEKREVVLGEYDEVLGEYEIINGLSLKDYITYPTEDLEEGMHTVVSEYAVFPDTLGADVDPEYWEDYDEEFSEDEISEDEFSDENLELTDEDLETFEGDLPDAEDSAGDAADEDISDLENFSDSDDEDVEYFIIDEDGQETQVTEDVFSDLLEADVPGEDLIPADEP